MIANSVFTQLKSSNYQFNDQGHFSIQNIIKDDAGTGISYLQSQFPTANLDFAVWAGTITARNGLGDSTYFTDYGINDLWVGSRDCNAIISRALAGGSAAWSISPSATLSNLTGVDGGLLYACTYVPNPALPPTIMPISTTVTDSGGVYKVNFTTTNSSNGYQDASTLTYTTGTKTWTDTTSTTSAGANVESATLSGSAAGLTGTVSESAGSFSESISTKASGAETITVPGGSKSNSGIIDANGATISEGYVLPRAGADIVNGNNDVVNVATGSFGKLGTPYSAVNDYSGTGGFFSDPGGSPLSINVESNNSSFTTDYGVPEINGDNYTGLTVTVDQGGAGAVSGIGTGSTVNMNSNSDTVTVAVGDKVNYGAGTTGEVLNASSATVTEGASSDANVKGNNDTIDLASKDKVNADGTGDHVVATGTGDIIDLPANDTVTVTGSGETIVGTTGDIINVTGTSDHIYADSSSIDIIGTDTGDIVYGVGDSGDTADWGGYVYDPGSYGGYGGGGYYFAAAPVAPAASRPAPQAAAGHTIADIAAHDASLARQGGLLRASVSASATLSGVRPQSTILTGTTQVRAVSAAQHASVLAQAMAVWDVGAPGTSLTDLASEALLVSTAHLAAVGRTASQPRLHA